MGGHRIYAGFEGEQSRVLKCRAAGKSLFLDLQSTPNLWQEYPLFCNEGYSAGSLGGTGSLPGRAAKHVQNVGAGKRHDIEDCCTEEPRGGEDTQHAIQGF